MDWSLEDEAHAAGYTAIAGVDEVGRGPLAGPVVAAMVILPSGYRHPFLRDSKRLTHKQRTQTAAALRAEPSLHWAIGEASVEEIDRHNILQATFLAMRRAAENLKVRPDFALVDGNQDPKLGIPARAVVGGDNLSPSIAAASIIAKEYRDRLMCDLASSYPEYGFEKHKGYGTAEHCQKLKRHGPCPIHRRTFEPIRQATFTLA